MSVKYLFFSLLAVIALSIAMAFTCMFAFPDTNWPLDKGERVNLTPGNTLTQTFVANRDGLRRIEILFGKFTLQSEDQLTLELRDSSCSNVIAQKILNKGSFDSEYTYAFIFDRISQSKDQTYCFAANFVTNRPIKTDKSPRFFVDKSAQGTPYSITSNPQEPITQPLAIRPGYTNDSFFSNTKELFDRISQYKPTFLKSWFLVTFAILGIVLTFAALVLLIKEEK